MLLREYYLVRCHFSLLFKRFFNFHTIDDFMIWKVNPKIPHLFHYQAVQSSSDVREEAVLVLFLIKLGNISNKINSKYQLLSLKIYSV